MNDLCDLGTPPKRQEEQCHYATPTNKKKRKSPGKVTSRKKGSKKSTPNKNVSVSPDSVMKIDLRLEAKLSAEENSRRFAGRQIHPFFSLWKAGKKSQEQADSECSLSTVKREGGRLTCGPVHVFENIQDVASSLDWSEWTFLPKATVADFGQESSNLSVLEGSVEPLTFDNFLSASKPSSASVSQNAMHCSDQLFVQQDYKLEILPAKSVQSVCSLKPEDAGVDMEEDKAGTLSGHKGIFRKSDIEPLSRSLEESMGSYYHGCKDKADGSLWINKYKPTKAFEVCGNDESLNFLRDWLHLWYERRCQSRKDNDSASKVINEEESLQNVLLITGPVGSGKSAAVYACAQEKGFEVLELNTSDYRSGVAVKQYYGDALGSHGFKSLLDHTLSSQTKTEKSLPAPDSPNGKSAEEKDDGVIEPITISNDRVHSPGGSSLSLPYKDNGKSAEEKLPWAPDLPNVESAEEKDDGMIELITISDDEAHSPGGTYLSLHDKNNVFKYNCVQTLILVEDVDILFPEDRGCIAAIQHIAETAKGPIILTSNSINAGLPDNFVRLHLSFSFPSPDELLCHLCTVCLKEKVDINPFLLEKFIQSCNGDIRKTIMQLQFWFQSEKYKKDREVQLVYGSLPFDLEAGHQILPKIMPWNYPSELSKLIEKEVSKTVTIMEENSCLQGLVKEELHINGRQNGLDVHCMGTDHLEAKVETTKRNRSITECSEFERQYSANSGLSYCPGTPVTYSCRKTHEKVTKMSSEAEDKDPNNGHSIDIYDEAYRRQSHEGNSGYPYNFQLNQSFNTMPFFNLVSSGFEYSEEEQCKYFETAIQNGIEIASGAVSSGHFAGNEVTPFTFTACQRLAELPQNSDLFMNTEIPESSPSATMVDIRVENLENTNVSNVMDECSHADFKLKSKIVECSPSMETDMVQSVWRKLRDCRTDLRQHAASEQPGAIQVVKLASRLSNLISESDLLFCNHQQKQCGIMEPPTFLSDEATFSWYDEQMMMSTVAEHGFCFYAKHISDVGSKLGCENNLDVTSDILASTSNVMALGKLSRQDHSKCLSICTRKQLDLNNSRNESKSMQHDINRTSLFNMIQSIVPARLSLAMKAIAFNEYLSSLRQISISEGIKKTRKRRSRGTQHYLSRGRMLSPEDISLVCEGDLYRKISSQYTTNMMEGNCT